MQIKKTDRNEDINKILEIMLEILPQKPHMGLNELTMAASIEFAEREIMAQKQEVPV